MFFPGYGAFIPSVCPGPLYVEEEEGSRQRSHPILDSSRRSPRFRVPRISLRHFITIRHGIWQQRRVISNRFEFMIVLSWIPGLEQRKAKKTWCLSTTKHMFL